MKSTVAVVILAMALAVSFSTVAWSQGTSGQMGPNEIFQQKLGAAKAQSFEGKVLSHDVACHCVVLKTGKGNLTLQDDYSKFAGDYDRAKGLKVGDTYKGTYKAVNYINYAIDIEPAK
jgi:hypothetical protein